MAVDFDLTLVDDQERVLPGAKDALSFLRDRGWKIIIWTTRNDLNHVREILSGAGVPFDNVNENPEIDTNHAPRKMFFDATVDDKAIPFQGKWNRIVEDLELRRAAWRAEGETKERYRLKTIDSGGEHVLATFTLRDGRVIVEGERSSLLDAIVKTGLESEDGSMIKPSDGVVFLKALSDVRGTYLWSEAF